MKQSGGISFTYLLEEEGEVTSGAYAFTITVDTENGDVTIVDSQGRNFVLEEDH